MFAPRRSLRPLSRSVSLIIAGALLAACSDGTAPGSAGSASLSVSFTTSSGSAAARVAAPAGGPALALTFDAGGHSLVIDRARLVLEEFEVEPVVAGACADSGDSSGPGLHGGDNGRGGDDAGRHGHDDGCGGPELDIGPLLVELPVTGGVRTVVHGDVPAGSYRELEYKINVADDDTGPEAAFLAANPEMHGASIRVEGTFDGAPFVFTTALLAKVELHFSPPLVVGDEGLNVTIDVDLARWFRDGAGQLIDPRSANAGGPNASAVNANIGASFGAFRDRDRDGRRDHS
jgi:hypothetical protein